MHEEKSRCYWYQFSDYTLVWPTNVDKSSEMAAFFVFKVGTVGGLCVQMKKNTLFRAAI